MNLVNRLKCPFCEKKYLNLLKKYSSKELSDLFINTINPMN